MRQGTPESLLGTKTTTRGRENGGQDTAFVGSDTIWSADIL
jgi:hypothetical protein